jgi:hypothetical protein
MMDIKGDFSGIARKRKLLSRSAKINIPYQTASFPVELLSLSEQNGVRLLYLWSRFVFPNLKFK